MDGTLIFLEDKPEYQGFSTNYASYISLRQQMKIVASSHGVPIDEYDGLNRMAHIWNKTRAYAESHGFNEIGIKALMNAINEPFTQQESADHARSVLIPGTIETLVALQNDGYLFGMVTNASRMAYKRISESTEFGRFGKYFLDSITRDDCDFIKPDPEPIHRILELFGRSDFIYIGDSNHDAEATRAARGIFILVNTRGYNDETIKMLAPHAVIHSITELPQILHNLARELEQAQPRN